MSLQTPPEGGGAHDSQGQIGHDQESDGELFGFAKHTPLGWKFEQELFGVAAMFADEPPAYKPYWPALDEAVDGQPDHWDPASPGTEFGRRLMADVKRRLPRETRRRLRFYLALESAFDYWHGVDAFFVWPLNGAVVTIDTAIYQKERQDVKADFLLTPDIIGDEEAWSKFCDQLAGEVMNPGRILRLRKRRHRRHR